MAGDSNSRTDRRAKIDTCLARSFPCIGTTKDGCMLASSLQTDSQGGANDFTIVMSPDRKLLCVCVCPRASNPALSTAVTSDDIVLHGPHATVVMQQKTFRRELDGHRIFSRPNTVHQTCYAMCISCSLAYIVKFHLPYTVVAKHLGKS